MAALNKVVQSASHSQQKPVLRLFRLFYQNGSRTLKGPQASADRVNV